MLTFGGLTNRSRRRYLAVFGALSLLFSLVAQTGIGITPAEASHLLDPGTTIDQQGPNDVSPARTDLSSMSFDDSHVGDTGIIYVTWNYDDTMFTSGSDINACALFDTTGGGGVNYAVCAEVGYDQISGPPDTGVLIDIDLWDCTNVTASKLNCTGGGGGGSDGSDGELGDKDNDGINDSTATGSANEHWVTALAPGYDTTCTLSLGDDPFAANPAHQANTSEAPDPNQDIVILCEVHVSDLVEYDSINPTSTVFPKGTHAGRDANLTNVCSYPSASGVPSSNAKDCIVTGGAGFITIVKAVDSAPTSNTEFSFTLNSNPFATITVDTTETEDSSSALPVAAGTYNLAEAVPTGWQLDSATCDDGSNPTTLAVSTGERVTCTFINSLALEPPNISLVKTANPTSLDEPGGSVTFTVAITNNGGEGTFASLSDDIHGDLAASCVDGGSVALVGQTIGEGETLTCTFTAGVNGNAGESEIDTVTGVVSNAVGDSTAFDDATVTINDVPSAITVLKTANPTSVPEPGGDVVYTFSVTNDSVVDTVTINSLGDSIYGDLNNLGDCSVPQSLASGDSYSCSITETVSGNPGQVINNVVSVAGTDDDGGPVGGTDDADVTITDLPSSIEVIKTANPTSVPENGGNVTYTFTVNNTSPTDFITINTLNDSIYGDLNGQGDCVTPQGMIAPNTGYTCSITVFVTGNADELINNVLTVAGVDDDGEPVGGTDDAVVTIDDVPSSIQVIKTASPDTVDEPGGDVTFRFVVNNTSAVDSVTIDSLTDSIYGGLNGQGDCSVPQTIAAGDSYSCSFSALVSATETNVVTASGLDDDGNPVSDDDDATVTVNDVPSSIQVIKTADPIAVAENGGDVTYTFTVNNTSAVDSVTIDSLLDSVYGDLSGQGDCSAGAVLAPTQSYSCSITETVTGGPGDVITNVLTVAGTDDDGLPVGGTDTADVTITDLPSSILVTKSANPTSVIETGGDVTFTFTVENTSVADTVTINTVSDDTFGDLSALCDSPLPTVLAPGEVLTCAKTVFLAGDTNTPHTNVATATGVDDDNNPVTDDDDEEVTFDDVAGSIEVIKTANPISVDEPGGSVTFSFVVNNTSAVDSVTIDTLSDTIYGDLDGQGDCSVPQSIAVAGSYNCSFTVFVAGNAGDTETNVATVSGTDDDDKPVSDDDDATVTIDDVPSSILTTKTANPTSVPETGGGVEFTITVENTSLVDDVTINTVVDSVFGDVSASCAPALPATLVLGELVTCTFTEFLSGDAPDAHTNVVTATGTDDDGNPVLDDDDETVPFDDVLPDISVLKTASVASVPETGGDVTFTFEVTNNSTEDATLDSLNDSDFGDLNGQGDCSVPQALAANGGTYSCSVTVNLSGDASGPAHENVVTAMASDDDGNSVSATDDETVLFQDLLPDVSITKTANPTSVDETGGDVEFTVVVTNNSLEDATIDSLVDSDFDLAANCAGVVGTVLGTGDTYTCTFTETLTGDASGPDHRNTATVVASDGDGNFDTESDDATVAFEDVLPDITVVKTANPIEVPETGGDVEFTIVVTNDSDENVTIDSLDDSDFDLVAQCADAVGTVLAPNATYTCIFTETVSGDASGAAHENTATAVASDNEGNPAEASGDATVVYDDVLPDVSITKSANPTSVPETGGDVEFTIVVTNNSLENATIDSLTDSEFDLAIQCVDAVGTVLATGGTYTCTFTEALTGDASGLDHENTATVVASDGDGNTDTESDDATVVYDDVLPDVSISKSANPTSVPETGGDVEFTIVVTNNSLENATIDSLTDSDFDLSTQCPDALGTVLATGASYTCTFTEFISGDFGGPDHENVAAVIASDNEGNTDTESDDETVTFTDVLPDVSIVKTANPTSVDEPGADVEFTIEVTNNSLEDATIDSLVDTDFDLAANCADAVGTVLASGDSYTCTFIQFVAGNPADGDHENTATVVASDGDGTSDTESDDETVVINDVDPIIEVTKTPDQDEVFAPGEDVTFTISVENTSVQSDPITITSLEDDVFDDLAVECALPVTIDSGATFECDITRSITADHTNTVTVTAEDDERTEVSDSASASVDVINPSLVIEKSTNGFDADSAPGPHILVGAGLTWAYEVTNNGDVALTNILVVDDQLGDICTIGSLAAGLTATCESDGTAKADGYGNVGSASTTYTDVDGDTAERDDSDPSNYFGAAPSVDITKAFADDSVIAGGTASSFTLVVMNDGNVDLDAVSITDTVDGDLVVSTVSSGDADCSASADQVVDCVVDLAVGESATVTVNFSVDSATLARDAVSNTANAAATYTDGSGNSTDIRDEDSDTIDILTDINLSIVKTFTPTTVSQGTEQRFTIRVSNAGPSDAVNVSVTDRVNTSLEVQSVTLPPSTGDCSDSVDQEIDCTIQIPAGESVTITVDYIAASDLTGTPSEGTDDGSRFKFVFVNGSILEGSANGDVLLNGLPTDRGRTKNDYTFNAPDGSVIDLHLSCSDAFTDGWGDVGGPDRVDDADWQIASFSITRYKRGDFFKSCGDIVVPLTVLNSATASGIDSSGPVSVSANAEVTIGPGVTVDRFQANGKKITVTITNPTGEPKEIVDVSVTWPSDNGKLKKVTLDGSTVWTGSVSPESTATLLDATDSRWNGGSLPPGESKLRFDFADKVERTGYVITVRFADDTSLDITN